MPAPQRSALRRDVIVAVLLGTLLSVCWAIRDWAQLGQLNLPDSDDMMRLAQVRDWIAGQASGDWTQYRLGLGGAPMHWSRIADCGPAAIIVAATPLFGRAGAELAAVLVWPALLFAAYLVLVARIARRIGPAAGGNIAIVIGAIAHPANSLFLPGRIDHHGLQIVVILAAVLALARAPSWRSGAAAGACAAISFGIGLETAPQVAALMAALFALWAIRGPRESARVAAFGVTLAAGTAVLLMTIRPRFWSPAWCDTFTPASSTATLAAGLVFLALGVLGARLRTIALRTAVGGAIGVAALAAVLARYPVCLTGPYGPVDPIVHQALIANIIEANGLFAGPLPQFVDSGVSSAGLMAVASIVAALLWWRRPLRRAMALPLIAALAASDLVLLDQLRGAYVGSALAVPLLTQLVLAARRRGTLALVGAWALSAGMLWLIVPQRLAQAVAPAGAASASTTRACRSDDVWRQLDAVPPGIVMTSAANAGHVIGGSHHSSIGASYHRNNAGNRAMFAFFLSPPDRALQMARRLNVAYVAFCPTDFAELSVTSAYPRSMAAALAQGRLPAWLEPVPLRDTGLAFYRVVKGGDR